MKKISVMIFWLSIGLFGQTFAQNIEKAHPLHWWAGMRNPNLQIMLYGKNIGKSEVKINYKGVKIKKIQPVENPNYLFLDLEIGTGTAAGKMPINLTQNGSTQTFEYELKARQGQKSQMKSFDPSDIVYLIMPDRFANGDPSNDNIDGMLEKPNRAIPHGRHGGDLQGIIQNLDYFQKIGVTALWLNPVLENDMKAYSYHGYAATDLYQVDRRFGGNKAYQELIDKAHAKGIKIIMDMVANHIGSENFLVKDMPMKDWLNQFPTFTRSNFRGETVSDPYASEQDKMLMANGWFDTGMPDLNQKNPFVANYLIQNNIWWIEESGIDGIRMDTYPYPDKIFMGIWAKAILDEYPNYNMTGEAWLMNVPAVSYWQRNQNNRDGYQPNLPSMIDFPLYRAMSQAFKEPYGWETGLARLYVTLSQDFAYPNATNNLIFLDNHDVTRFFTEANQNMSAYKMGTAFLLTTRGIPQWYYGTEFLMTGDGGDHPSIRFDFAGGWAGDKINVFKNENLKPSQEEALAYFSKLANWRKTQKAIHKGKLTHFVPNDNLYVYFRHTETESVMVILHSGYKDTELDTQRFAERLKGFKTAKNVLTDEKMGSLDKIKVPAYSALVLELEK